MAARPRTLEVFKDRRGEWRWRLVAGNGEIQAQSEGYSRRWSATRGARRAVPGVLVVLA